MVDKCWRQGEIVVSLNRALNVILGLAVLVGSAFWSWTYWSPAYQVPVKYLSIAILTRTIEPGGTIIGRTTSDRIRQCPTTPTDRYIINLSSNGSEETVFHDLADATPVELGLSKSVLFRMKLPADRVPPGNYIFRAFAHYDCNGQKWTLQIPEASFRVCAVADKTCRD
jgi:hypothetical protein